MVEFQCDTLTGNGEVMKVKFENGRFKVVWGETPFEFPYCFLCQILKEFFVEQEWYLLGANISGEWKGLGKYMIENQKYFPPSPKYASAIASIMVELDLIEFRELSTRGNPIQLKRK